MALVSGVENGVPVREQIYIGGGKAQLGTLCEHSRTTLGRRGPTLKEQSARIWHDENSVFRFSEYLYFHLSSLCQR
jgi:hypothetical protein